MGDILDDSFQDIKEALENALRELEEPKGLTLDQKRIHWEAYAKKTERQEEVFKRVFENVFNEQKGQVIGHFEKNGTLDSNLLESDIAVDNTAKKFEPAIELVYHDAFEDAI